MVEVIREHDVHHSDSGSGISTLVGIILVLAVVLFLFYYFGRGLFTGGTTTPQINVPDRVNVDVNQNP